MSNLLQKLIIRTRITDPDIGSLFFSTQYLDHMLVKFEQNRMIRNTQSFELFGKKNVSHF